MSKGLVDEMLILTKAETKSTVEMDELRFTPFQAHLRQGRQGGPKNKVLRE